MKHNKIPSYSTKIVCSDGSTVEVNFPYEKSNIFLNNDFKNNPAFISPLLSKYSRGYSQKIKQKSLQFDFYSLMDKKD